MVAKIGVDTEENELSKVCRSKRAIPPPYGQKSGSADVGAALGAGVGVAVGALVLLVDGIKPEHHCVVFCHGPNATTLAKVRK